MTHNFCTKEQTISENKLEKKKKSKLSHLYQDHSKHSKKKILPLAKVSLVDEKLSSEKGQSLQHLISMENHHQTLKEM